MMNFDICRACDLCGRILENFNFSSDVTFVKNAAGQVYTDALALRLVNVSQFLGIF